MKMRGRQLMQCADISETALKNQAFAIGIRIRLRDRYITTVYKGTVYMRVSHFRYADLSPVMFRKAYCT